MLKKYIILLIYSYFQRQLKRCIKSIWSANLINNLSILEDRKIIDKNHLLLILTENLFKKNKNPAVD
jgi:hypothetical protein